MKIGSFNSHHQLHQRIENNSHGRGKLCANERVEELRELVDDFVDELVVLDCSHVKQGKCGLIVKTLPTMTPPETEGIALIVLAYWPFLRGHRWTRSTTGLISIFPNEINELGGLTGGVNVRRVFTLSAKLAEWESFYNLSRPHGAFDGKA